MSTSNQQGYSAELEEEKESLERMLAISTDALKKLRQMRGSAAHERAWHYEDRIAKTKSRLEEIRIELERNTP